MIKDFIEFVVFMLIAICLFSLIVERDNEVQEIKSRLGCLEQGGIEINSSCVSFNKK